MKRIGVLTVVLTMISFLYASSKSIDVIDGCKAKKVSMKLSGLGGYQGECLQITLKNISSTPQEITIPTGLIFKCNDSTSQDLMSVENYMLALKPSESKSLILQTMCVKQRRGSPSKAVLFAYSKKAVGPLLSLAELIAEKNYHNSTAQAAVWAITDDSDLGSIYAEDTLMAKELVQLVSKETGKPIPPIIPVKPHYIYSVKLNITHHFPKATKVTLTCYNEDGTVYQHYYKDKLVPMGMYAASISCNMVADKGTKFIYRLTDDKGTVIKERTIAESTIEDKIEKWRLDVSYTYMLQKPIAKASLKLYDAQGVLMEELYTNRALPAGSRKQTYSFHHTYGNQTIFFIRLLDEKGTVVVEQKLDGSKSIKIPY